MVKEDKKIEKKSLKDEEFTIISELDRKKKYLRVACREYKEYEADALGTIKRVVDQYQDFVKEVMHLQSVLRKDYMKVEEFSEKHDIHTPEKEKLVIDYEVISEEFGIIEKKAKGFISKLKDEEKCVDYYANKLYGILIDYSKTKDSDIATKISEKRFKICVAEMLIHAAAFHMNIHNANKKYELTRESCQAIVSEYSIIVNDFVSHKPENLSDEKTK